MGDHRSKEDDVRMISISIYVTNFPNHTNAKELWSICSQYGNLIDSFIPNKRSKIGKWFGFVRFIKTLNVDLLVNNLCTIWIGQFKLHANVARFNRQPLNKGSHLSRGNAKVHAPSEAPVFKDNHFPMTKGGTHWLSNSYIHAFKSGSNSHTDEERSTPTLVLDDSCLHNYDYSLLLGSLLHEEDEDAPHFHRKRLCIKTTYNENIFDTFKIIIKDSHEDSFESDNESIEDKSNEGLFEKNSEVDEILETIFEDVEPGEIKSSVKKDKGELEYPPGFTPCNTGNIKFQRPDNQDHVYSEKELSPKVCSKEDVGNSVCSGHFKKETKMEQIDIFDIRSCWGNLTFDFVVGPSFGNSGGILCVWDTNMFHKENSTVSDYFIAIMEGWKGEVIIMGDFNEVRTAEERFGSLFNASGAAAFNSFISIGGLVEVPSGGYSYTWVHKSVAKMSKLDRFLISEDLMSNCPNISSINLDRYLSDHRPILLCEINIDYGPIPFRFFHHWFDLDGFDSFVTEIWHLPSASDPTASDTRDL
ncbi:RNA-directed DNA polymerase, eukaryota [Tanacetum coccineum]